MVQHGGSSSFPGDPPINNIPQWQNPLGFTAGPIFLVYLRLRASVAFEFVFNKKWQTQPAPYKGEIDGTRQKAYESTTTHNLTSDERF